MAQYIADDLELLANELGFGWESILLYRTLLKEDHEPIESNDANEALCKIWAENLFQEKILDTVTLIVGTDNAKEKSEAFLCLHVAHTMLYKMRLVLNNWPRYSIIMMISTPFKEKYCIDEDLCICSIPVDLVG